MIALHFRDSPQDILLQPRQILWLKSVFGSLPFLIQHVNPTMKVETAVMTEAEFLKHLAKEATGVVINPLGISLLLQVNRKKSD